MLKSYIDNLDVSSQALHPMIDTLCDNSSIFYRDLNRNDGYIMIGFDSYVWGSKDIAGQLKLKEHYLRFFEHFKFLFKDINKTDAQKIDKLHTEMLHTIDQTKAYGTIDMTKVRFRTILATYKDYLNQLAAANDYYVILVPDTNALIQHPDAASYRGLVGVNEFQFVILPTVLSELDKLKVAHRDAQFRDKVKAIIRRLKGLRTQGDILSGVTVDNSIKVKMIASEPDFSQTLSWLDSENSDDRIIASALEIQKKHPSSLVAIVTGDINLQNKAQMANFAFLDSDDLE